MHDVKSVATFFRRAYGVEADVEETFSYVSGEKARSE